jgi:exodeoxyribonuclease VII large subunit
MKQPLLASLFDETERKAITVSDLTKQIRGALENRFASVWVEGEISNFKAHTSGHWYFTLKDEGAQIRATCFRGVNARIRFRPQDGMQVTVRGRVTVYEPRGDYQLSVESMEPVGVGALQIAFEQMRDRLAKEGLFDEKLKRPLPLFPHRVGVVTSPTGAAIRDIMNVLKRRTRTVNILLAPAKVQGDGSAAEIVRAIRNLNQYHEESLRDGRDGIDVIIVGRGGGSVEDLWSFNEESVARAIRASAVPIISAVGHETDFTIADFVADLRAPTPSAAAEIVAAREDELLSHLETTSRDLVQLINFRVVTLRSRMQHSAMSPAFNEVRSRLHNAIVSTDEASHRIEILIGRLLTRARTASDAIITRLSPERLGARVAEAKNRFTILCSARDVAVQAAFERSQKRLALAVASLDAMSPLAVLKRGYAIALDEGGRVISAASSISVGDAVRVRLAAGKLNCRVEEVES